MAVTNGKIEAPMSVRDAYVCMGVTPTANGYDVGYICSNAHGKVNKWSKNKPYDNSSLDDLTDDEKKGTAAQRYAGIFYGLYAATETAQWSQLHDITYEYVGYPKGGNNSIYRLTDFLGYDHNAKPTINATIPSEAYINIERSFMCDIEYDSSGSNTTGVDIAEIINTEADATKFDSYYPCILVGNYARALFNDRLEQPTQTPIKYNNAWYTKFYCDLAGYPGTVEGEKKCTLFFIRNLYQAGIYDVRDWLNVTDMTLQARQAFGIPNAIAIMCDIKTYNKYPILNVVGVTRMGSNVFLTCQFADEMPTDDITYTIHIIQPTPAQKDYVYNVGGVISIGVDFSWSELGFIQEPSGSVTISGTVNVENTQVSSFNFTV